MRNDIIISNRLDGYLLKALRAGYRASQEILHIYNSKNGFSVESKADNSPLTAADRRSHDVICSELGNDDELSAKNISGGHGPASIPILSEEGKDIPYPTRKEWKRFWLVDPLDGTKEFIRRNGEFTVNIALIMGNTPVIGVVCVPVKGEIYFGAENIGSYRLRLTKDTGGDGGMRGTSDLVAGAGRGRMPERDFIDCARMNSLAAIVQSSTKLPAADNKDAGRCYTVIASRSHMNRETGEYIESLKKRYGQVSTISAGSSLKLCLVAQGAADCYPRLGPTMEWDTAAAHAVARYAGKQVIIFDTDDQLQYNKESLLNPWFVVK